VSGHVVSVNVSARTGERKEPVGRRRLVAGFGLEGDAHGGSWHRQVSLLAAESIDKLRSAGVDLEPGAFGENLTTIGIDLCSLHPGDRLKLGGSVVLEMTQLGKECTEPCAIYHRVGDCVMPREGIFARVLAGGEVVEGDKITVVGDALVAK
jgi:molybdopterin adenylyltransferase